VKTPSQFPPDERPTESNDLAVQAAQLVKDWRACSLGYRRMLLRLAARGAKLPKKPFQQP
jgi:hypothetical protein